MNSVPSDAPLDPDLELFRRAAAGDQSAFEGFYHRILPLVRSVVGSVLRDLPADVPDVCQRVFMKLGDEARRNPGKITNLQSFVRRVAANAALDHRRSEKTRFYGRKVTIDAAAERGKELAARDPGPEDQAIRKEVSGMLWEAVQKLSPQVRTVVLLTYLEDLTVGEVAGILGIEEHTVRVHQFRGRARLRAILARKPAEESL